jgi:hypothetical protein
MEIVGSIKAILNNQLVLIQSDHFLKHGEIVQVFQEIKNNEINEKFNLDRLFYPKGNIRIICEQTNNFYLAERFREIQERIKTITEPSPLEKSLSGIASVFQGEKKEIVEKIPGEWSAIFNQNTMIKVEISNSIDINDLVGKL